ncbi:glycosyltransferase, partial [Myxococcota bacterium]|nr:glycosyltransferase [Myxococcota bacterium]
MAHIMTSGATGGGSTHLRLILPELQRQGVSLRAIVGNNGPLAEELQTLGVDVSALNLMGLRLNPLTLYRLRQEIEAFGPDLVHLHGSRAGFYAALLSRAGFLKQPLIYSVHGLSNRRSNPILRGVFSRAEKIAIANAAKTICVSRVDRDDLLQWGFGQPDNIMCVPNPVRLSRPPLLDLELAENKKKLLVLSRLELPKRVDWVLRAVA